MRKVRLQLALCLIVLVAVIAGCASLTAKKAGVITKQTAESAYAAIYGGYLDGTVTDTQIAEARKVYDTYYVGQKALYDALVLGETKPTIDAKAAYVTSLSTELVSLAVKWGVLKDGNN
jgi:hypothetical protein